MRWPVMIFMAMAAAAAQMSLVNNLAVRLSANLTLTADLLAILIVFVTIIVRERMDALWAAWLTGLLIDLSVTAAPVGLNALTFTLAAAVLFNFRSVVFTDSPLTQAILTFLFCVIAHGAARGFMNIYVRPGWGTLWPDMLQMLVTALCTAVVAPVVLWLIQRMGKYMLVPSARRRGR